MTSLLWLGVGVAVGFLLASRRRRGPSDQLPAAADAALLPEPALTWLAGARGALGVWVSHPVVDHTAALEWSRVLPGRGLAKDVVADIDQRLAAHHREASSGAVRLDAGTLLYASAGGLTAGMLLPAGVAAEVLQAASSDLVSLLDGLGRKPMLDQAIAEAETPVESLGSVGLRLAYQLERVLQAEVIVTAALEGVVRVIGTSGRADRRLLDTVAGPQSPLAQVATGREQPLTTITDPLGGVVPDRRVHIAPAIVLPIRSGEETVGAVACWTGEEGMPVGGVIAEVQEALRNAGPRIARARRFEELGSVAVTDPLTGLKNRRGLDEEMRRVGVAQGTLVYADFDKFKLLNDTLGHHAGDAALVHFARIVHDTIRGGDTAARIGGEEFAIWLPGAPLVYGAKVADRIRVRLGTTTWDWQGRSWPLSISAGVAAVPDTTRSIENLPVHADAALARAKQMGRNRIEVAEPAGGR